ncbi:hypothetical protein B6N60_01602 [Richelia sinica FACHB-800]|uniref:Uncharacterized protein n=1 Tax=Richelia sinica FACHB-800 TaxID=1357546 RepID=A0A975T6D6_9NOST|nr:hypothetical protein [Richelia sinica]MBD2663536.1 hypothetical protein [Richelia sinica FACHB-800]QXE22915.1 hypothetical protein B6N60_01602 [Richelia sinica FACHB-800]
MLNVRVAQFISLPLLSCLLGGVTLLTYTSPGQAQTAETGFEFAQTQNFERYFVYVDTDDPTILERVRLVESGAYIRPYNGRNVIQSGVFNRETNAVERVRDLEAYGVGGARVVSFTNGEEISPSNNRRRNIKAYYVVIPSDGKNLTVMAERVRRIIDQSSNVMIRSQPLGAHLAIGPFNERLDAEQWNNYIRKSGYGNARVYYGR